MLRRMSASQNVFATTGAQRRFQGSAVNIATTYTANFFRHLGPTTIDLTSAKQKFYETTLLLQKGEAAQKEQFFRNLSQIKCSSQHLIQQRLPKND